ATAATGLFRQREQRHTDGQVDAAKKPRLYIQQLDEHTVDWLRKGNEVRARALVAKSRGTFPPVLHLAKDANEKVREGNRVAELARPEVTLLQQRTQCLPRV